MSTGEKRRCVVCGATGGGTRLVAAELVHGTVGDLIRADHPDWGKPGDAICLGDLNRYRSEYVEDLIAEEGRELTSIEKDVVEKMREHELISADTNVAFERGLTVGERLSDRVARFGGSWAFIVSFGVFLMVWMAINVAMLRRAFDPYPFILLNLILSTVAALQAPIIMMSQNRQESKDRLRAEHDYRVNLKAELEIRLLNERVDALVNHQWQRLIEIQKIQLELMQELEGHLRKQGAGGKG